MKKYLPGRRGREGIPGKENRSQARAVTLENARCVSVALQQWVVRNGCVLTVGQYYWGQLRHSWTFSQDEREGSVSHENVEILSSWLINSHWSEVPPIVLLHSPDLLTLSDSGIRVVSQQEAFRTLLPLCQLMRIKGEEEKPEDNVWLHICLWREDKEEPERQTHELFNVRRKCKEFSFPLTGIWAPWGQRPQGYLIYLALYQHLIVT